MSNLKIIKETIITRFLSPVFSVKQVLLVSIDLPRNNCKCSHIFVELFIFVVNSLIYSFSTVGLIKIYLQKKWPVPNTLRETWLPSVFITRESAPLSLHKYPFLYLSLLLQLLISYPQSFTLSFPLFLSLIIRNVKGSDHDQAITLLEWHTSPITFF